MWSKRYFCKSCRGRFNDKAGTILHYSKLSLREWFMPLLLELHNSSLGLSLLPDISHMKVFRALRKLMLKLKDEFRGL
jgi:transposase-like protein